MTLWILTLSVIFTVTVSLCHTDHDEFYCLLLLPCYGETNIDVYRALISISLCVSLLQTTRKFLRMENIWKI